MTAAVLGFRSAERFRKEVAGLTEAESRRLIKLIKEISLRGDQVFVTSDDGSQRLMYSFDLGNGQDASAAAAASMLDERVRQAKNRLVESKKKQLSEQNFFFNYFSHVTALLNKVFEHDDFMELQTSIRALIRVENCAHSLVKLSWELYGWGTPVSAMEVDHQSGRTILEPIIARYGSHGVSKADIYTLAGCLAVEEMGGPRVAWRSGRVDEEENDAYYDDTYFSEQERVCLSWLENSDCRGPFDNSFFHTTLSSANPSENGWIRLYGSDSERFIQDFRVAFCKLQEYRFKFDGRPGMLKKRRSSTGSELDMTAFGDATDLEEENEAPLKFQLPKELEMFDFTAEKLLECTKEWRHAALTRTSEILDQVRQLTLTAQNPLEKETQQQRKVSLHCFRTLHPETPAEFTFNLDDPADRRAAMLAAQVDKTISKFKPSLVPKISEADFYRHYFSHVFHLRKSLGERSKPKVVKVYIGSKNPVKVNACKRAFLAAFKDEEKRLFEFCGMDAPSGVPDQPMGDQETKTGAINRAMYCRKQKASKLSGTTEYYVGIEGGLTDSPEETEMLCFAWVAVLSNDETLNCSRTATFTIPPALASLVRKGIELGRADDIVHGKVNSKQKGGTVGTLTSGRIDRTAYYAHAMILALAPFANPTYHI